MTSVSAYRRNRNRCESIRVEYGTAEATDHRMRSWRCQLVAGHSGLHESTSGHRRWSDEPELPVRQERLKLF